MSYLIYRHIRLDKNEPFYIGISDNMDRPYSKHSRNRYWKNIVKLTDYRVDIILSGLSRIEVEEKEKEFILLYGRKDIKTGILCNLTDGGTGGYGYKHTDETKLKMKKRNPYNKGKSKWSHLENKIVEDIKIGYSETFISKKYGCSSGVIYRIKLKYNLNELKN